MIRKVAPLLIALSIALVAASSVGAAPAAQVCAPFKQSGVTFHYETLGNSWTCGSAKTWIAKLSADSVAPANVNVPLKNGPRGLHCIATPRKEPHALDGDCILGTIAFPRSGFAWSSA